MGNFTGYEYRIGYNYHFEFKKEYQELGESAVTGLSFDVLFRLKDAEGEEVYFKGFEEEQMIRLKNGESCAVGDVLSFQNYRGAIQYALKEQFRALFPYQIDISFGNCYLERGDASRIISAERFQHALINNGSNLLSDMADRGDYYAILKGM